MKIPAFLNGLFFFCLLSSTVRSQTVAEDPAARTKSSTPDPMLAQLAPAAEIHATLTIPSNPPAKAISSDLFGIFIEDLNYTADGGLYAELVQNRSFEYSPDDNKKWNALTCWELVERGEGKGSLGVAGDQPLHPHNPHYAVLTIMQSGEGVGLSNEGFDGIVLKAGDTYDFSVFARQLSGMPGPYTVRLESKNGEVLGETTFPKFANGWTKYTASIQAGADAFDARLVLLAKGTGSLALDMISLFPRKTFHDRPNGLRPDLAQVIADLKPKFVRFPGGCLAHGDGLDNMYRWEDTIGPVEQRKAQRNIWRYHQTVGLGYFEYFQFCEDIGAKPLPVLAAGVCCQNAGRYIPGAVRGQQGLPLDQMPEYIQEVLDLVEYANGPVNSKWGARRVQAGHPAPFGLQYLGIGNEDQITPVFKERFEMIYEAVKRKHPEITVVGTVGPAPNGRDFEEGWKIANELQVPLVDEHYYKAPAWFWDNLSRYDKYNRAASHVYVGEYAAHDAGRKSTLRAALAEAAHMTALERNGDVVRLASYAPLLAKQGHTQWLPDLIYFDNTKITPSINYYVQQIFGANSGDESLPTTVNYESQAAGQTNQPAAVSCVRDHQTGDLILKLVSQAGVPIRMQIDLAAAGAVGTQAICTVVGGKIDAQNVFGKTPEILPKVSALPVSKVVHLRSSSLFVERAQDKVARNAIDHTGGRFILV